MSVNTLHKGDDDDNNNRYSFFLRSNRGGSGSFQVHCIWDLPWTVDWYHRFGGTYCAHLQAADNCSMNLHLRGIWTHMPCARTHLPVGRYLCSVVEAWNGLFCACLFTRRRTADDLFLLQNYLWLFFETFFLRGIMKLLAAIGKALCLISVYKSQRTWISAMGIIRLVMEVRVLGTPFTGLDLYFWEYVKRLMNSYDVSWTVMFSCVTSMKALGKQLALRSNELACA